MSLRGLLYDIDQRKREDEAEISYLEALDKIEDSLMWLDTVTSLFEKEHVMKLLQIMYSVLAKANYEITKQSIDIRGDTSLRNGVQDAMNQLLNVLHALENTSIELRKCAGTKPAKKQAIPPRVGWLERFIFGEGGMPHE